MAENLTGSLNSFKLQCCLANLRECKYFAVSAAEDAAAIIRAAVEKNPEGFGKLGITLAELNEILAEAKRVIAEGRVQTVKPLVQNVECRTGCPT